MPSVMLSAVLEEEPDLYEAFPPHVDPTGITILTDSPPGKKAPLKTFEEIQPLIQQGRKRELKLLIRENSWPINSPVRASLWPALCRQHQHGKSMLDGFYWDMVTQVFGTVELPDKPIGKPHNVVLCIEMDVEGSDAANDRLLAFLIFLKPRLPSEECSPCSED